MKYAWLPGNFKSLTRNFRFVSFRYSNFEKQRRESIHLYNLQENQCIGEMNIVNIGVSNDIFLPRRAIMIWAMKNKFDERKRK